MQALIHLYETFSEALHTVQELEAAQIAPDNISLMVLNGQSDNQDSADARQTASRSRFFSTMALHKLPGLDPVASGGWIVADALKHPSADETPTGLVTCLVAHGLTKDYADTYVEGIKHGQALVGVRVSPDQEETAKRIMCEEHAPLDPRMRGRHYETGRINSHELIKAKNSSRSTAMLIGGGTKN